LQYALTPETASPNPKAKRISVVEGAREMYRGPAVALPQTKKRKSTDKAILPIYIQKPAIRFWRVAPKYLLGPVHEALLLYRQVFWLGYRSTCCVFPSRLPGTVTAAAFVHPYSGGTALDFTSFPCPILPNYHVHSTSLKNICQIIF
jgi:hypothetical protein